MNLYDNLKALTSWTRRSWDVRDILPKHNGKASLKVPIDVAMKEPRASVVGDEPNRDVVVRTTRAYNITARWIGKVRRGLPGALDDRECVSVKLQSD
jgi:hypothetical protein